MGWTVPQNAIFPDLGYDFMKVDEVDVGNVGKEREDDWWMCGDFYNKWVMNP